LTRQKSGRALARYPTLCDETAKDGAPGFVELRGV
jgi:hypothetical protein